MTGSQDCDVQSQLGVRGEGRYLKIGADPGYHAFSGVPRYEGTPETQKPPGGIVEALGAIDITVEKRVMRLRGNETRTASNKRPARRKSRELLSWWFAVRVKHGRERYARRNVERQGHKVWVPWVHEEGRPREQPLFPGYIFVLGPAWYYLQATYGVLYPIMMGDVPARMPKREMSAFMKAADREGVITIKREKFVKGQAVRVKQGSWHGVVGSYIKASGTERVRVLFELLGGIHELEFDRTAITSADDGLQGEGHGTSPAVAVLTTKNKRPQE